jgi:hypothetical protein
LQKYNFCIIKTFVIFITYLVKMPKYFISILYFVLLVKWQQDKDIPILQSFIKSTKIPTDILAYSLLVGIFLIRFTYIGTLGIAPDEAYYWDWSRKLSFGYYDHPPMVAWFIYLSTKLFGDTLRGVKFMAIAASFFATFFSYRLAKKYVSQTSSLLLFIVISNTVILYGIGCFVAVPDIPMILFWSLGLLFAYKFIFEESPLSWFFLGFTMGFGLLSKYIFVLFIISLIIFLICFKSHHHLLRSRRLYGALFIAFIIFLPNIIWNSHHHWITVLFQFHHGLGSNSFTRFDFLGEYITGQIGVLSVFPFIVLFMALISEFKNIFHCPKKGFLILFYVIPFLFFAFASLQKRVEANWASPAYISGLILVPILWETVRAAGKKAAQIFIVVSTGVSCAALVIIMVHIQKPFLPLSPNMDPTSQVRGWKQWAVDIQSLQKTIDPQLSMPVCANRYQEAALLGFYLPNHPKTVSLNFGSRENHYSLAESKKYLLMKNLLLIYPTPDTLLPPDIAAHFERVSYVGAVFLWQDKRTNNPYCVFNVILKKEP